MLYIKWTLICLGLALAGCKTVAQRSSDTSSWAINGNESAARRFIATTVVEFYSDTQNQPAVVEAFAAALVDQKTDQSESAGYVLQTYADKDKSGDATKNDFLQQYILSQFIVFTNYLAYHADPSTTPLVFKTTKIN